MPEYVVAANTKDSPEGTMRQVNLSDREYLIASTGDKYYASPTTAVPLWGNTSRGTPEGTIVTCPPYQSQFDLSDRHVVRWIVWNGFVAKLSQVFQAPRPLGIYPVRVEQGRIMIGI
ncbi:MAG: hypothetical protein ABIB93_04935 [Chloroflexota bacterium]